MREHKDTALHPTRRLPEPAFVSLRMSQHIGAHATPVVKVGDYVKIGQVVGEVTQGLGCPIHASISGTVKEITSRRNATGTVIQNVVIENDGKRALHESVIRREGTLAESTTEEIIEVVRRAGISGLGGATFPTYAKLQSAVGKVDTVIINCAECEPYLTANHRLLLERGEIVVSGLEVVMHALGVTKGILAVEDNKEDAIVLLEEILAKRTPFRPDADIRVCVMKTKYPQGDERQLVYALMKKEIPAGKLPADIGVVIINAETSAAISRAFWRGVPLVSRIVTVTGDCVVNPGNVRAPIGASVQDLISFCGGLKETPKKMVSGGPMMGTALWDPETPVSKGMSGLLVFSEEHDRVNTYHTNCIHCGRCVSHCPMHLMPYYLALYAKGRNYEKAEQMDAMSCVECGTCTYNCPAGVEIVQYIRVAKGNIRAKAAALRAAKEQQQK